MAAARAKSINLARAIDEANGFIDIPRQSHELPLLKLADRESHELIALHGDSLSPFMSAEAKSVVALIDTVINTDGNLGIAVEKSDNRLGVGNRDPLGFGEYAQQILSFKTEDCFSFERKIVYDNEKMAQVVYSVKGSDGEVVVINPYDPNYTVINYNENGSSQALVAAESPTGDYENMIVR
ncbi:MAG: hypothetical protein O2962_03810 [Cyanobacteria bacterium]|nr:hypothetical protein [Cyanobacteriota bacterium]